MRRTRVKSGHAPRPAGDRADAAPQPRERRDDRGDDERPPPAGDGQRGADEHGVDGGGDETGDAIDGFGDGEHEPVVGGVDDAYFGLWDRGC